MQLKRSKRPAWEIIVVTLVVGLAMWMAAALYAKRDRVVKERLLILELQTLRNLSAAYMMERRSVPKAIGDFSSLQSDPFGHAYQFHSRNGWISATTPGYQTW